jgi:hypothetical protein
MLWTDGLPNTRWSNIPLRHPPTRVERHQSKYIAIDDEQ